MRGCENHQFICGPDIRGCTCTIRPVQRPMSVYFLTWGSWRRSKASCKRWTKAVERMTPFFERVNRRPLNRSMTVWADLFQSAFRQRRRWRECGDSETSSRLRGMRQLWGIKVTCEERKASRGEAYQEERGRRSRP